MSEDSLRHRLDRFQSHLMTPATSATSEKRVSASSRACMLADTFGGRGLVRANGEYTLISEPCPMDDNIPQSILRSLFSRDDTDELIALERIRFIDTETTGLGGTGAVPFLIGIGRILRSVCIVDQYLLPDYSDEAALLSAVAESLGDSAVLVSYNGIAFDLPVMLSRATVNRVEPTFTRLLHLDLLYPARRLFKRRLRDCSLGNLEQELLGIQRTGDISGYLIPSTYFDWLNQSDPELLRPVLTHNRQDIVSLALLTLQIDSIFRTQGELLDTAGDLHSLARTYGYRRKRELVEVLYRRMTDRDARGVETDMQLYHARNYRRLGQLDTALSLLARAANGENRSAILASIELSKIYEHDLTDPLAALNALPRYERWESLPKNLREDLARRLARLMRKTVSGNGQTND